MRQVQPTKVHIHGKGGMEGKQRKSGETVSSEGETQGEKDGKYLPGELQVRKERARYSFLTSASEIYLPKKRLPRHRQMDVSGISPQAEAGNWHSAEAQVD